ncbi:MAG: hypothetical protein MN733_12430 [Nitrososphaera sp.]|nr:hypothetical protein [Nitrososphaera sp.]
MESQLAHLKALEQQQAEELRFKKRPQVIATTADGVLTLDPVTQQLRVQKFPGGFAMPTDLERRIATFEKIYGKKFAEMEPRAQWMALGLPAGALTSKKTAWRQISDKLLQQVEFDPIAQTWSPSVGPDGTPLLKERREAVGLLQTTDPTTGEVLFVPHARTTPSVFPSGVSPGAISAVPSPVPKPVSSPTISQRRAGGFPVISSGIGIMTPEKAEPIVRQMYKAGQSWEDVPDKPLGQRAILQETAQKLGLIIPATKEAAVKTRNMRTAQGSLAVLRSMVEVYKKDKTPIDAVVFDRFAATLAVPYGKALGEVGNFAVQEQKKYLDSFYGGLALTSVYPDFTLRLIDNATLVLKISEAAYASGSPEDFQAQLRALVFAQQRNVKPFATLPKPSRTPEAQNYLKKYGR